MICSEFVVNDVETYQCHGEQMSAHKTKSPGNHQIFMSLPFFRFDKLGFIKLYLVAKQSGLLR